MAWRWSAQQGALEARDLALEARDLALEARDLAHRLLARLLERPTLRLGRLRSFLRFVESVLQAGDVGVGRFRTGGCLGARFLEKGGTRGKLILELSDPRGGFGQGSLRPSLRCVDRCRALCLRRRRRLLESRLLPMEQRLDLAHLALVIVELTLLRCELRISLAQLVLELCLDRACRRSTRRSTRRGARRGARRSARRGSHRRRPHSFCLAQFLSVGQRLLKLHLETFHFGLQTFACTLKSRDLEHLLLCCSPR